MTIGERIKERRVALGLSVDEVAEKLGKNRATVYRYENEDISNLPISILGPLSQILQTTPAHLMGWEEPEEHEIQTIAAHHDGDEWTEEELNEIEQFKAFVRMRKAEKAQKDKK